MELLILDTNLKSVAMLDTFESLIWTDRYCGYGDFEIYTQATIEFLDYLKEDYYIWCADSDHLMLIESLVIKSDIEKGNCLLVTGRSIESIINRRIIWTQTVLTGNFQNGIKKLLDENVISPIITDRAISNFIFEVSTDPIITALTVEAQFTKGLDLYDTIQKLCSANNIGFKLTLSETNQFIFKLYAGIDRSYDQLLNPYVVFSPKFDNLTNSNYEESQKIMKTLTVVDGEGEGINRKTTIVGGGVDLSRREMYTDASSINQTVDDVTLSDADYIAQLIQKGIDDLNVNSITKTFDGEADTLGMYKYGIDFFMGDIVQIASDYGLTSKSRVTELIRSQNANGITAYPTFTIV